MTPIFVLENDPERIKAMRMSLERHLPNMQATFINNAPEATAWLEKNLSKVQLISLDHDLGPEEIRDGKMFDPGSGRDVASYLGAQAPVCPVIVHTDNFFVRPTMQRSLEAGGWTQFFVAPGNLTLWVEQLWIKRVVECLAPDSVATRS